ncbi:hypothetical protein AAF143_16090 [Cyanobium sp. ATX-6F1]
MLWLKRWNFIERAKLERELWEAFERGSRSRRCWRPAPPTICSAERSGAPRWCASAGSRR